MGRLLISVSASLFSVYNSDSLSLVSPPLPPMTASATPPPPQRSAVIQNFYVPACTLPPAHPSQPQQFTVTTAGFPFPSEVSVNQESPGSVLSWLFYSEGKAGRGWTGRPCWVRVRTWVGDAALGTKPGVDRWVGLGDRDGHVKNCSVASTG